MALDEGKGGGGGRGGNEHGFSDFLRLMDDGWSPTHSRTKRSFCSLAFHCCRRYSLWSVKGVRERIGIIWIWWSP